MDAGIIHETHGSETKDFITHCTARSLSFILVYVGSRVPQIPWVTQVGLDGFLQMHFVELQERKDERGLFTTFIGK